MMKKVARHKWILGATITESVDEKKEGYKDISYRRFTATIRGFRNWKIYEGYITEHTVYRVKKMVEYIRDCIDKKDNTIFDTKGYFLK